MTASTSPFARSVGRSTPPRAGDRAICGHSRDGSARGRSASARPVEAISDWGISTRCPGSSGTRRRARPRGNVGYHCGPQPQSRATASAVPGPTTARRTGERRGVENLRSPPSFLGGRGVGVPWTCEVERSLKSRPDARARGPYWCWSRPASRTPASRSTSADRARPDPRRLESRCMDRRAELPALAEEHIELLRLIEGPGIDHALTAQRAHRTDPMLRYVGEAACPLPSSGAR